MKKCARWPAGSIASFRQTADNPARLAHLAVSTETLRQLIKSEGQTVLWGQRRGALAPDRQARDCRAERGVARVDVGLDGVLEPLVPETKKQKWRAKSSTSGSDAARWRLAADNLLGYVAQRRELINYPLFHSRG